MSIFSLNSLSVMSENLFRAKVTFLCEQENGKIGSPQRIIIYFGGSFFKEYQTPEFRGTED